MLADYNVQSVLNVKKQFLAGVWRAVAAIFVALGKWPL